MSTLNSEISLGVRHVANLEQEKRDLEARIRQYESEISARKSRHKEYEQQISAANHVKSEIAELERHAQSTTSNVTEDNRQLQKMKQTLDQCNSLIKARSLDVETSESFVEHFAGLLGPRIGNNSKRTREFRRQKEVMEQVSQTLEQIHSEVPLLLPSQQMKFLDVKPWNTAEISVTEIGELIPAMSYFLPK